MLRQNVIAGNAKLTVLLILCLVAGCGNKADSYNKKGISLYNRGKYTEAIEEFKRALELNPNHYDARFHLGIVYYAKGMIDESIAELKKAIDTDHDEPKAHYNIAFAYVAKENVEDALSEYQKAIKLFAARKDKKKEAEGYLYMAVAYSLIEKNEEAFAACRKALEINPDLEDAHYFLGVCYYKKNMIDEAIAAFKKVIQLNPKSEKAHNLLFTIYDKIGKTEEAIEEDRILKQIAKERREQR
ncbi:MAG: tetratricopeptide repeat protein [Candidatus Brocadia sp.]|jgi:superkiller protein 3